MLAVNRQPQWWIQAQGEMLAVKRQPWWEMEVCQNTRFIYLLLDNKNKNTFLLCIVLAYSYLCPQL